MRIPAFSMTLSYLVRFAWNFLDDSKIKFFSDGSIAGLVPFLPGWFFFNLYAESKSARSVFITIEDVLAGFEEEQDMKFDILSKILDSNSDLISSFLGQLMPSQMNFENVLGFRWEEEAILARFVKMAQSFNSDENVDVSELTSSAYFSTKWSENIAEHARAILLIESLSQNLPSGLMQSIVKELKFNPLPESEIAKRLKVSTENTLIKQIALGSSIKNSDSLAPTDDYSKPNDKKQKMNEKAGATALKNGQTSLTSFFMKKVQ